MTTTTQPRDAREAMSNARSVAGYLWEDAINCDWSAFEAKVVEAVLAVHAAPAPSEATQTVESEFKNFHRLLCERFGYVHDESEWRRDLASLEEHIARQVPPAPSVTAEAVTHPDDIAVDSFARAMKVKMAESRAKGRNGWQTANGEDLSRFLREHVEKGDPRDVANFCMMLWCLASPILPAAQRAGTDGDALSLSDCGERIREAIKNGDALAKGIAFGLASFAKERK